MSAIPRRTFFGQAGTLAVAAVSGPVLGAAPSRRPNILFLTADDMNYDSLGVTGCKIRDITPNIDRLAAEGIRFTLAHNTIAVCQPNRSVWMTGRYPHRNGAVGFNPIRTDVPTLQESLRTVGYLNGIFAKVPHLAPLEKFCWDVVVEAAALGNGRSPKLYYEAAKQFFEKAKSEGKPFFLMANSQDPHRPFPGSEPRPVQKAGKKASEKAAKRAAQKEAAVVAGVSRVIQPDEVEVPGFLPDLPDVRREVAQYFTAVHRCDEIVGEVLRALRETGLEENTVVMFNTDNGMAFPFAKTNCYLASTATPWIVRWPGRVKAGALDTTHFISSIDFTPTVLDLCGAPPIAGVDGRSFVPLLYGKPQEGRDSVYTVFHRTSGNNDYPMRSIVNAKYGYIYNGWSDGKTVFKNESQSGLTFAAMRKAAETDAKIAERVQFFLYRVPEELYDYEKDPCALQNRIADPALAPVLADMRKAMLERMTALGDPLTDQFRAHIERA